VQTRRPERACLHEIATLRRLPLSVSRQPSSGRRPAVISVSLACIPCSTRVAANLLPMFGVPTEEAREIAARPLPKRR
jgi:hypothetical protein